MMARFGIGRVFATGVRIFARNLPRFLAIAAVLSLPYVAWVLALLWDPLRGVVALYYEVLYRHPVLRALPGGGLVVHTCIAAAVTHGALVALTGQPAPIGRGLSTAARRFFPVIGVALVVWLATTGVVTALRPLVWSSRPSGLEIWGTALCSTVLHSLFYLAVPVATVERRGVVGSIVRGIGLARGNRIRVFAIVFVLRGVSALLYPLILPFAVRKGASELYLLILFGHEVVFSLLGAVIAAVAYRLLREDKEGPDAGELVKVFE
ncbi:MAG TPA: hypothetical protein VF469_14465 [Kofleriaceae bacterium]